MNKSKTQNFLQFLRPSMENKEHKSEKPQSSDFLDCEKCGKIHGQGEQCDTYAKITNSPKNKILKLPNPESTSSNIRVDSDEQPHTVIDDNAVIVKDNKTQNIVIPAPKPKTETIIIQAPTPSATLNYACPHCNKSFRLSSTLKKHEPVHAEGKQFSCHICDQKFKWKPSLKRHEKKHLIPTKTHECNRCEEVFQTKDSLEAHESIVHDQFEPYQCVSCEFSTVRKAGLWNHIKLTHNLGRVDCNFCAESFSETNEMKNHMHIHANDVQDEILRERENIKPVRVFLKKSTNEFFYH